MMKTARIEHEVLLHISNLVFLVQAGAISFVNPAGMKQLGATDESQVLGHPVRNFVDPAFSDMLALGLEAFAEEDAGVPLKLLPFNRPAMDVQMIVSQLGDDVFLVECRDISEFIRSAEEARKREQRLSGILGTIIDAVITMDDKGSIQTFNPAAEQMFGHTLAEARGQNVKILMPQAVADAHDGYLSTYLRTGIENIIGHPREVEGQRKDGTLFPAELAVSVLHEHGHPVFTGIIRDITERKKAEDEIRHLAHHDSLTGLPNRNLYNEHLNRALVRSRRSGNKVALMFLDLDKFKPVNDELGHEAGDQVLIEVANRLNDSVRGSDTVARLGGDEFVVIAEDIEDWRNAGVIAAKIIEEVRKPVPVSGGRQAKIGASIGIAFYPDDGHTADAVTKAADEAMYEVKEAGRNAYRYHKHHLRNE